MATSLSDLKQKKDSGFVENPEALKTLSPSDLNKLLPPKEDESSPKEFLNQEFDDLDNDLLRREESDKKVLEEAYEKLEEEEIDDAVFDVAVEDIDNGLVTPEEADKMLSEAFENATNAIKEDENIKAGVEAVTNVNTETVPENMEIEDLLKELDDDDDVFSEDDDNDVDIEEDEENEKKMLKEMQTQVEDIIKPFNNIIDLKSFTISTKAKSVSKVLQNVEPGPTATWVLLDSGVPFTCTALGAVEIENLDPNKTNSQNGRIDALKQMYGTLFRHYTSPNKPEYLEQWVKTISYSDHDNLIFGYYKATFGNCNLVTYACEKCKDVKIKEVPIEDCIKYKDDETKKEVQKILKYGDPSHKSEIKAKLIQVSDKLAVSIKSPSIYNIVFEFGVLEAEFTRKFADVLGTVGYIEDFYEIDVANQELVQIRVKEDPDNITKSVKRRIRSKVEILKTLTPDQYQILTAEIAKLSMNAERISYCQPKYVCEKCGNPIEETEMTAQEMLFMRHQLALVKTLSIE